MFDFLDTFHARIVTVPILDTTYHSLTHLRARTHARTHTHTLSLSLSLSLSFSPLCQSIRFPFCLARATCSRLPLFFTHSLFLSLSLSVIYYYSCYAIFINIQVIILKSGEPAPPAYMNCTHCTLIYFI